jgi:predicted RNA methylase
VSAESASRPPPAPDYDTFVNWDARLARELPFFRSLFDEVGATSVIDVGAGSARHAIEFASLGMDVVAVDPDDVMLAAAERLSLIHISEPTRPY